VHPHILCKQTQTFILDVISRD